MCGFVCWVSLAGGSVDEAVLRAMNATLRHRGPDDEGIFVRGNVGLAHRRLSIIDTSAAGRQPMATEDGAAVVAFNGEIYNHRELRAALEAEGRRFRGRTDTEVLLQAFAVWGTGALARLDGMFSAALYDHARRRLVLAVDPFGKKPLYYALVGRDLVAASELKALRVHPAFDARLDRGAVARYLAHDFVPSPGTIFAGCHKLRPGSWIEVDVAAPPPATLEQRSYWRPSYEPKLALGQDEAAAELRRLLGAAVRKRLMSDVPLGVFLSGGLDSSAVVWQMAEAVPPAALKTFCIGFEDPSFDESAWARRVAAHFGTDHQERRFDDRAALDVLPDVVRLMDEPFADPSILPTYLLSRFARESITVALGGDGGDEVLAGYDTFVAQRLAPLVSWVPGPCWSAVRQLADAAGAADANMSLGFRLRQFLKGMGPGARRSPALRNALWMSPFPPEAQADLFRAGAAPDLGTEALFGEELARAAATDARDDVDRLIDAFTGVYLHDDILVKADRASMMASLELRSPFLDKDLATFAARLPASLKLRRLERKWVLKRCLAGALPDDVLRRPKKGFGIPVAAWLRGPLRPALTDVLAPARVAAGGLFAPERVAALVADHLEGRRDYRKELWALFVFETWRQAHGVSAA